MDSGPPAESPEAHGLGPVSPTPEVAPEDARSDVERGNAEVAAPEPAPVQGEEPTEVVPLTPPEPSIQRDSGGQDRIFRGQRVSPPAQSTFPPAPTPAPPPAPAPSAPVAHGPLPPPAPIPVPEWVREAVSEPIGQPADTEQVPSIPDEAGDPPLPTRGSVRRDEPLRARPVFRRDLTRSAGDRPSDHEHGGPAGNGERRDDPEAPDPTVRPETSTTGRPSREDDAVPSALDTLAALYPPPPSGPPPPEKTRRRRLRRS